MIYVRGKEITARLRQILVPLMGAALMAYFAYHAVQGDRGLIAWWKLSYQIERTELALAEVTAQRKVLEHRVSLLRPESLDRDMLEERARIMLGYVHPKEHVVPLDADESTPPKVPQAQ